jgi:hypothetical protein
MDLIRMELRRMLAGIAKSDSTLHSLREDGWHGFRIRWWRRVAENSLPAYLLIIRRDRSMKLPEHLH